MGKSGHVNMTMNKSLVHGIPCRLRNQRSRRVVARVLRQIKEKFPKDFARLKSLVYAVIPVPDHDSPDTMGRWLPVAITTPGQSPVLIDYSINGVVGDWDEISSGFVQIREDNCVSDSSLTAIVAHELGHACSTSADIKRRQAPIDVWCA